MNILQAPCWNPWRHDDYFSVVQNPPCPGNSAWPGFIEPLLEPYRQHWHHDWGQADEGFPRVMPSFSIEDAREAQATIEHALATLACGAPECEGWERVCRRLRQRLEATQCDRARNDGPSSLLQRMGKCPGPDGRTRARNMEHPTIAFFHHGVVGTAFTTDALPQPTCDRAGTFVTGQSATPVSSSATSR